MHHSGGMEKARTHRVNVTGACVEILRTLKRCGPLSRYKIFLNTGLDKTQIDVALAHLLSKPGCIVSIPAGSKRGGRRYWLFALYSEAPKPEPKPERHPWAIAGRITVGRGVSKW